MVQIQCCICLGLPNKRRFPTCEIRTWQQSLVLLKALRKFIVVDPKDIFDHKSPCHTATTHTKKGFGQAVLCAKSDMDKELFVFYFHHIIISGRMFVALRILLFMNSFMIPDNPAPHDAGMLQTSDKFVAKECLDYQYGFLAIPISFCQDITYSVLKWNYIPINLSFGLVLWLVKFVSNRANESGLSMLFKLH